MMHTYSSIVVFVSGWIFIFMELAFSSVIGRSRIFTSCTLLVAGASLISGEQNFMRGYARTWDKGSITLMHEAPARLVKRSGCKDYVNVQRTRWAAAMTAHGKGHHGGNIQPSPRVQAQRLQSCRAVILSIGITRPLCTSVSLKRHVLVWQWFKAVQHMFFA